MVKFIEYGNGKAGRWYKMPVEFENFPAGALKVNMKIEGSVQ